MVASNATKPELNEAMDTMIEEVSRFDECTKQTKYKKGRSHYILQSDEGAKTLNMPDHSHGVSDSSERSLCSCMDIRTLQTIVQK